MIYEAKFKINRAPLRKLWKAYTDYCESMPENHALTEKHIVDCDRKYQAFKNMERYLDADAWNVFMKYGMVQDPESEYYNGNTIDWDRHIMIKYPRSSGHTWVKFEITQKNVDAFYKLLEHLAPVLTTMTRFKMYREVAHKLMLLQFEGHGAVYPVLGTITAYNDAEILERGEGLADCPEFDFDEVKSADFKRWKASGMDKFEFTLSVRDTPHFMKEYDDILEGDCREYYEMTI